MSGVTQRVTISLFHRNDNPWANSRAKLLIGAAGEIEVTTDEHGEISVELQPLNTLRVTLLQGYDDGHGKITDQDVSGTGHGALVAYANVRDLYHKYLSDFLEINTHKRRQPILRWTWVQI